ncbi:transporter substrate-binding domain-containing protein [Paraferrimonas sp. SM1919]|uniref:transporter substrate-binding domain-containing protein n=1 Tax=Paraferrimonas sp. SM1919 TaxID=2662263 RepID=UPI0021109B23|nr:transporter substrate-binding domain-containing protein [Paraferrimonas sp. SM1919]
MLVKICCRLLLGVLVTCISFLISAKEVTKLKVAFSQDSAPLQYIDTNGMPKGLMIEQWQHWSKQTGIDVEFVGADWQGSIQLLDSGQADVHAGMANLPSRAQKYQFANPLLYLDSYIYSHRELNLKSTEQLKPYRIGVVKDSVHLPALKQHFPELTLVFFDDRTSLLKAVKHGHIKAFAGVDFFLKQNDTETDLVEFFTYENAFYLNRLAIAPAIKTSASSLLTTIDVGFEQISEEAKHRINNNWLGKLSKPASLKIATPLFGYPLSYRDPSGHLDGILIGIWKLISQKLDKQLTFVEMNKEQSLLALREGHVDAILASPGFDFDEQLTAQVSLYTRQLQLFSSSSNIKNNSIVAVSPRIEQLEFIKTYYPNVHIKYLMDAQQKLEALDAKNVQAVLDSGFMLQHLLDSGQYSLTDLKPVDSSRLMQELFIVTNKKSVKLTQQLQLAYDSIPVSRLHQLEYKWNLPQQTDLKTGINLLNSEELSYIRGLGEVNVAYLKNWFPLEFEHDGQYQGANRDLLDYLQHHLGVNFNYIGFDNFNQILEQARIGNIDVIASMRALSERESFLNFSKPYFTEKFGVLSQNNTLAVASLEDLKSGKVAIIEGYDGIADLFGQFGQFEIVKVANLKYGLNLLEQSKVDYVVDKITPLLSILTESKVPLELTYVAELSSQESSIAVTKGLPKLVELFDRVLENYNEDDFRNSIMKWSITKESSHWYNHWQFPWFLVILLMIFGIIKAPLTKAFKRWYLKYKIKKVLKKGDKKLLIGINLYNLYGLKVLYNANKVQAFIDNVFRLYTQENPVDFYEKLTWDRHLLLLPPLEHQQLVVEIEKLKDYLANSPYPFELKLGFKYIDNDKQWQQVNARIWLDTFDLNELIQARQ